jgi:GTP-binding protein
LKVVADAALVGYPNAGKSTLISRVSAARPKIADYPFTTLTPNLGVVDLADREFVLADVPGLIEGAADGKGLGHEFLRHVERARVLVLLLDPTDIQEDRPDRQYEVLIDELSRHDPALGARPRLVAVNKADVASADPGVAPDERVFSVSAVTGEGVDALMHAIADLVAQHEREAPDRPGFVLHRPLRSRFEIKREGDTWVVAGRDAERAVGLDDLTVAEAADFAAARLAGIGVDDALIAAGARAGDDVRIGDIVFTFEPDEEGGDR